MKSSSALWWLTKNYAKHSTKWHTVDHNLVNCHIYSNTYHSERLQIFLFRNLIFLLTDFILVCPDSSSQNGRGASWEKTQPVLLEFCFCINATKAQCSNLSLAVLVFGYASILHATRIKIDRGSIFPGKRLQVSNQWRKTRICCKWC